MIDRTESPSRFTRPATTADELLLALRSRGWTVKETATNGQRTTVFKATATKSVWHSADQKLIGTGPKRETALKRLLALTEAFA